MNRIVLAFVAAVFAGTAFAYGFEPDRQPHRERTDDWSLLAGVDFDMFFDNREYTGCELGLSQTLFSSRLTPLVGLEWGRKQNRLMFGMDFRSDFGDDTKIFAEIRPQIYYRFHNRKFSAYAGIFNRENMMGDYGEMIMSDSMRFYDNRIQGVMGQYRSRSGYVELSVDWCGMYSEASREKFRVMSAGCWALDRKQRFYGGYALSMLHFANSKLLPNSVVDNITLNPYLGVKFTAWMDFDIRLNYVQTMQRDRVNEHRWQAPKGGLLGVRLSKWGLFVDEQLYVGEDLQPFYSSYRNDDFPCGYGGELYSGERFFGTGRHIYNNLKIGYDRWFFRGTLGVKGFIAMQYDGAGWGTKQLVQVSVRLLKDIPLHRRR